MNFKLRGGVLLIGSLFWQNDRTKKGDNIRKDWRCERLSMDKICSVNVPSIYGRFSKGKVYTMVFDDRPSNHQVGKAKVISFKNKSITSWDELKSEVEELSDAEGQYDKTFIKGSQNDSKAWCVCTIIFNPKVDAEIKYFTLNNWEEQLKLNAAGYEVFIKDPTLYSVKENGELDIEWPAEAKGFDFLIATSTKPTTRHGVEEITVPEIVKHIPNRPYFMKNFLNGIGTYQDRNIVREISESKPLTQSFFKCVIQHYQDKMKSDPFHRYCSWNQCYETFNSDQNEDHKALHLALYLASWGMYRGSGGLLQKNYKLHEECLETLAKSQYQSLNCSGNNDVSVANVDTIIALKDELSNYYSSHTFERGGHRQKISATHTLTSKILLGTHVCVPGFDDFFKKGLKLYGIENTSFTKAGVKDLFNWIEMYEILQVKEKLPDECKNLPMMKLLDIFFWSLGYNIDIIEK